MSNTKKGLIREIYEYRHLLYSMVARDLKGKYKSSYLGFAWHFLTPALMVIIFYVAFTGIGIRSSEIDGYWIYLCIGMFPFVFFRGNLGQGSGCVVSNAGTIKKMYFPREIVVLSQVISTFVMFLISYLIIVSMIIVTGFHLSIYALLFLPVILLLSFLFTIGYVLFFSAIVVFVRDVQHFILAVSRVILWTTPILYLASDVTGILETIIWYNPFTYFIEVFHSIFFFGTAPEMFHLQVCLILTVTALVVGMLVFSKLKPRFAEVL